MTMKILGSPVRHAIEADALDTFPTPVNTQTVKFIVTEFTSMCPVTNQPDFGTLEIEYGPDRLCLESKSLKLYLWGFRDKGSFCEALASNIAQDIYGVIQPKWIKVTNRQATRGGIVTESVAEIEK